MFRRKKLKGECSLANELKPISDDAVSPRKEKEKNIMRSFPFIMPIPDKYKELSEKLILKAKFDTDDENMLVKKPCHASVERIGQMICVAAGHPHFLQARAEERAIVLEKNRAKKAAYINEKKARKDVILEEKKAKKAEEEKLKRVA